MRKKQRNNKKDILFILISSFIVVVAWIAFNIYHIYVTSTINQTIQAQLTPINPTFDPNTIKQLRTRENIVPDYTLLPAMSSSSESAIPSPTVALTSATSASESSQTTPVASSASISRQGQ